MTNSASPQKTLPLVIFNKQLGDVLLLEPALAKLAASSQGKVRLATRKGFAPLLELMENVEAAPERFPGQASSVISFDPTPKACFQAFFTRAPEKRLIVTRPKHLRWWHRWLFPQGCASHNESAYYRAEYFFNVVPGIEPFPFRPPRLKTPPTEWLPQGLPENFVLLHATSAWQRKSWPAASWVQVLTELHKSGVGPFVITGGNAPWELEYAASLVEESGIPLLNLCGKTQLRSYLAIASRARLVLCVDGSATHLAAAFNRPSVTLFGPTNPLHWHYPSPNATLLAASSYVAERKPAVSHIPATHVIEAALAAWNRIKP